MIFKRQATSTRPSWNKTLAGTLFTIFFNYIMILIWMFAIAFKILRTINGYISIIWTFTSCHFAFDLIIGSLNIIMIFIRMITEAFRRRSYVLTNNFICIIPSCIQPILWQFRIILFILFILFFTHHHASIVTNQITILYILIYMLHSISLPFWHFTQLHRYIKLYYSDYQNIWSII